MPSPSQRRDALHALALALLAAAVVLGPGWLRARQALIGDEGLDVWSHAAGLAWVAQALSEGRLPWRAEGLAWPEGGVLWFIDPLGALAALAPLKLGGTAFAYNCELLLQAALAALGGRAYGRALGGRGWIAALGLASTPWLLGEWHNGIAEAGWVGFVALAGAAAARGQRRAGLWVGLAGAATPYHGLSAAVLAGAHVLLGGRVLAEGAPSPALLPRLKAGAVAAGLTLAIALPPFLAFQASLHAPDALARKPEAADNFPVFRINAVDPVALLRPGDFWTVDNQGPLEAPFRRTPYLGLGLLVLTGLAVSGRRGRAWLLLPAGLGACFALGPWLWHDGDWVRTADGQMIALPFRAFLLLTGVSMDHPLRFIGLPLVILGGLADSAVVGPRPRLRRGRLPGALAPALAALVTAEQLLLAPSPWPLQTADAAVPAVYAALPPDGRAVIDLPADRGDSIATNRYLYWQSAHRRPIPYAAKVGSQGFPSLNPALRAWTAAGRLTPLPAGAPGAPQPGEDLRAAAAALAAQGFGWVVLHPELLARPGLLEAHRAQIDPVLGPPAEIAGALVWALPDPG